MGTEHPYDCIGPHIYARPVVSGTAEEIHERNMALAADSVTELDELEKAIAEHAPDDAARACLWSSSRPTPRGFSS